MRKLLLAGVIALLAVAPAYAADLSFFPLAHGWDMDGEAADVDQVVTAAQIVDSKDDYTIAANPDTCRLIDITIVDADSSITAGEATITGTDCLGYVKSVVYTITGGSGVKSKQSTYVSAYFKTVTKVETGVITGEGGAADTIAVGYSTGTPNQWTAYGQPGRSDDHYNHFQIGATKRPGNEKITTNGVYTTSITEVTTDDDPFDFMAVGDILFIPIGGRVETRKIVTYTDDSNIVVDQAINIPAAGAGFSWSKFVVSSDPFDLIYLPVSGYRSVTFSYSVDANANTGGVVYLLECTEGGLEFPTGIWYQVATSTTASGSTQTPTQDAIDLTAANFQYCRINWSFGTNDDADAADEDINASFSLVKSANTE